MLISFTLDKDGFRVSKPLDARFVTNVTYIKAHFDVSEPTWNDAKVLVAVFKSATYNESCRMILDENNNCFVEPKVFMRGGTIQVKLCGDAYDSDWVRCTTHLTDTVEFFVRPESLLTAEPPSKYAVFLAEIERLREEYAGSGVGGTSKSASIPYIADRLNCKKLSFDQHDAITIDGTNTTSDHIIVTTTDELPPNRRYELIRSIKSTVNQNIFSKMTGYEWEDNPGGSRNRLFIYFSSTEPFTIEANTVTVDVIQFYMDTLDRNQICYIEGSCEEEGGGSAA